MTVPFLIKGYRKCVSIDANAAGPIDIPLNKRLKQYCSFPIVKCVYRIDSSSSGIWLYALFRSAVVNIVPLILVRATSTGSIAQLHLDSSIMLFKYLASSTIFRDSPFRSIITGFVNVFPVDSCSLLTGAMMSYFFNISNSFCILSRRCIGTLLIRCFLKIASFFIGRFNFTFVLPTSNFVVAYTCLYCNMVVTTFSNSSCVSVNVENQTFV